MATVITPRIVNENVTVAFAPQPSQLQQSGALISVGATSLATGTYQYCASAAAVIALLGTTGNYAEVTNMANTYFAQGNQVGIYVLELGANTNVVDQVNALQTFITNNPGVFYTYLTPADWDTYAVDVGSITFPTNDAVFSAAPEVTITAPTGTDGVQATATSTIDSAGALTGITITNPGYYPDQQAPTASLATTDLTSGTAPALTVVMSNAFNVLASNNSSDTAKMYFFGTTTPASIGQYSPSKALFLTAPAPTAPSTEFTAAAMMYQMLVNNPGATNKLAPQSYRYLIGVTPWNNATDAANIQTVLSAYGNLVMTGAEGGLSNTCEFKGTMMDGIQASNWYGVDWFQIQERLILANAVINGSNSNPPLLYDQEGINTLEAIAQQTADSAVTFGCALSATVTATPFYTYAQENPSDYQEGIYNGLIAQVTAQNGFLTITFNINVSEFAAGA